MIEWDFKHFNLGYISDAMARAMISFVSEKIEAIDRDLSDVEESIRLIAVSGKE